MTEAEKNPAIEQLHTEALLDMAPSSIGIAGFILTTTFNRGRDDIGGYTVLARALIQHTLSLAERRPALAAEYKAQALPLTFNFASFTWPGWGEGNVAHDLDDRHRRLGMEAAQLNVALHEELTTPPARRKNGYWVLGIHHLADGTHDAARDAFSTSRDLAATAGLEDSRAMAQGWIHFTNILAGKDESAALADIDTSLRKMGDDGTYYADQYATAMAVFRPDAT